MHKGISGGSSQITHCGETLPGDFLWLARRDLGAVLWTANADLIFTASSTWAAQLLANVPASATPMASTGSFRPATPLAATWAHRNAAARFDGHSDARRWLTPFS